MKVTHYSKTNDGKVDCDSRIIKAVNWSTNTKDVTCNHCKKLKVFKQANNVIEAQEKKSMFNNWKNHVEEVDTVEYVYPNLAKAMKEEKNLFFKCTYEQALVVASIAEHVGTPFYRQKNKAPENTQYISIWKDSLPYSLVFEICEKYNQPKLVKPVLEYSLEHDCFVSEIVKPEVTVVIEKSKVEYMPVDKIIQQVNSSAYLFDSTLCINVVKALEEKQAQTELLSKITILLETSDENIINRIKTLLAREKQLKETSKILDELVSDLNLDIVS